MAYSAIAKELYQTCFKDEKIRFNFLCDYHSVQINLEAVKKRGLLLAQLLNKVDLLYRDAILQNNKQLLEVFETGVLRNKKNKEIHRDLFLNNFKKKMLIFRMDSTDLEQVTEYHIGLRGLGYLFAFRKIMDIKYGKKGTLNYERLKKSGNTIAAQLKEAEREIIFYKRSNLYDEVNFFLNEILNGDVISMASPVRKIPKKKYCLSGASALSKQRKLLQACPRHLFVGKDEEVPIFWGQLAQKVMFNNYYDLFQKVKEKQLEIYPEPNLLHEQKIASALVWDNEYSNYFSDEEKNLFPRSYIIKDSKKMLFEANQLSLDDILGLSQKKRLFIVKYAGLDLNLNWGSRGVYSLKQMSRKAAGDVIKRALKAYKKYKEPWIIQPDVSVKEEVQYFDIKDYSVKKDNFYKLYRPYFYYLPDQDEVEIIDIAVLFRKYLKVHGKEDVAFGLVDIN